MNLKSAYPPGADVPGGILGPPHQVNGGQRVGGGHVRPCLLDGPNRKLGLGQVIPTGCLGNPQEPAGSRS